MQLILQCFLIAVALVAAPRHQAAAAATGSSSSSSSFSSNTSLPLGAVCADGSIPLNSLQQQFTCNTAPQVQWRGRKCDNSSHACPRNFVCTERGLCCATEAAEDAFWGNLCRLSRSNSAAVHVSGACSYNSDCASLRIGGNQDSSVRCCDGRCVLHKPNCARMLRDYMTLQSTGQMPRQHLPSCKSDGSYAAIQSDSRLGISWCVNETTGLAQRSGCCRAALAKRQICPAGQVVHSCPRDMCSLQVCSAQPAATCRVNPCGGCRVEFVNSAGQTVNCAAGLNGCAVQRHKFYQSLATMHRWDQLHPEQHYHLQEAAAATTGSSSSSSLHNLATCPKQLCVHYNASLLERQSSSSSSSQQGCPWTASLGYSCGPSSCNRRSSCSSGQRCCYTGCKRECVKPVAMATSNQCSAVISSGHCPSFGCHSVCKRWGWDASSKRCRPFWYAGVGGNNNRYMSWAECMWAVQHCHTEVLIALPWKPECRGRASSVSYNKNQYSDNGFSWCASSNGQPTAGSLHAASIACRADGSLVKDRHYERQEKKYIAKCPSGQQPKWCHLTQPAATCQAPGIYTFADACNNCAIVHFNEDGERVQCPTATTICSGDAPACQSPINRYTFNSSAKSCQLAKTGPHTCPSSGSVADHSAFSREDFCMHACNASRCPTAAASRRFFPDLCVMPNCSRRGVVCVADSCNGVERYMFLDNGTEVVECRRQFQHLDLQSITASCSSSSTPQTTATPAGRTSTTSSGRATTTPSGRTSTTSSGRATTTPAGRTTTTTTTPAGRPSTSTSITSRTRWTRPPAPGTTTSSSGALQRPTPLCRLRSLIAGASFPFVCSSTTGQYVPRQCNSTHCYCVFTDSGVTLQAVAAVTRDRAAALSCPSVQTTSAKLDLSFDADYSSVLPTAAAENKFKIAAKTQLSTAGGLPAAQISGISLRRGSIVVQLELSKEAAQTSVDLPAAVFQLKSAAERRTLKLEFEGQSLQASAKQQFNDELSSSQQQPQPQPLTGDSGSSSVAGVVGGVVAAVVVIALAGVAGFLILRRWRSTRSPSANSQLYETMSNSSGSTANIRDGANFENCVYASGIDEESHYDNLDCGAKVSSTA